jgi:hypothetical protein
MRRSQRSRTLVCVLPRELGHGVAHLGPHRRVRLVGQAAEQLGADGLALGGVERQEEVDRLARGCLPRFRRLPPEDDGRKGPRLHM